MTQLLRRDQANWFKAVQARAVAASSSIGGTAVLAISCQRLHNSDRMQVPDILPPKPDRLANFISEGHPIPRPWWNCRLAWNILLLLEGCFELGLE